MTDNSVPNGCVLKRSRCLVVAYVKTVRPEDAQRQSAGSDLGDHEGGNFGEYHDLA
jgi:hypothetical protein